MLNKFSVVGYFFQKINFLSQFFLKLQGNDVFFHCKDVRSDFKWGMNINNEVVNWMKSHKGYFLITEPKIQNGINLFPCNMLAAAVTLLILTFVLRFHENVAALYFKIPNANTRCSLVKSCKTCHLKMWHNLFNLLRMKSWLHILLRIDYLKNKTREGVDLQYSQ